MAGRRWALGVLGLLLILLGSGAASEGDEGVSQPHLLYLSDNNFEHDTQAASGQTTGAWLVLFNTPDSAEGKDAEEALRKVLAETEGHPLLAKVDVSRSPKTGKRFSATDPPHLKLFQDRHMFTYSGDWSAASISEFVKEGWKKMVAEEVPKDVGLKEELTEIFQKKYSESLQFLGSHPVALALVGSVMALAGYTTASSMLRTKSRRSGRRPGKARARAKKSD